MKDLLHKQILKNKSKLEKWFQDHSQGAYFPFYSSVDIRDGGAKIASVDANIYPAGFNNICDQDLGHASILMKDYLVSNYKSSNLKIVIFAEPEGTNRFYLENLCTIKELLEASGAEVRVGVPKDYKAPFDVTTPRGRSFQIFSLANVNGSLVTPDGFTPELAVSQNDFSVAYGDWLAGLKTPLNPSHELGWFKRKKSTHFEFYNEYARQFAEVIGVDPWTFTVDTEIQSIDFGTLDSVKELSEHVAKFIDRLNNKYRVQGIDKCETVVFVKNNSGTQGMGIVTVKSAQEVLDMTQKLKKKMAYGKGGKIVTEFILQEGIPTDLITDGDVAEPVIYLIGNKLAGGFMRTNKGKGPVENLNSPGAVFKKLCMSDLKVDVEGSQLENVYGWVAKLSGLAISREAKDSGASF